MEITAFDLAQRYVGIHELAGTEDHPLIRWWLSLCGFPAGNVHDEVPWCSAFVNGIAWELRLPRTKSAAARSWLTVGRPISLSDAGADASVVILKRGDGSQPGPEILKAQGHVGFYAGMDTDSDHLLVLGGNQDNGVSIERFPVDRVLGVRWLST